MNCGAVQEFTNFSLRLLQLANETLEADLSKVKESVEETIVAAGRFISRKEALRISQVKNAMSEEALKQAGLDSKAAAAQGKLRSLSPVLATLLADNLKQKQQSTKSESDFKEFAHLRSNINTVLQFLFSLATNLDLEEKRSAVRLHVEQLLLLLHDLAHATQAAGDGV